MFLFLGSFVFDVAYFLSNVLVSKNYVYFLIVLFYDPFFKTLTLILGDHLFVFSLKA
jgi:hypothetical protein